MYIFNEGRKMTMKSMIWMFLCMGLVSQGLFARRWKMKRNLKIQNSYDKKVRVVLYGKKKIVEFKRGTKVAKKIIPMMVELYDVEESKEKKVAGIIDIDAGETKKFRFSRNFCINYVKAVVHDDEEELDTKKRMDERDDCFGGSMLHVQINSEGIIEMDKENWG